MNHGEDRGHALYMVQAMTAGVASQQKAASMPTKDTLALEKVDACVAAGLGAGGCAPGELD